MKVNLPFYYLEGYIPKGCRKWREHYIKAEASVTIPEIDFSEDIFPLAFIVKKYDSYYEENAEDSIFEIRPKEIRAFKNVLYSRVRANNFSYQAPGWANVEDVVCHLTPYKPYSYTGDITPADARDVKSYKKDEVQALRRQAKTWLIVNNNGVKEVWQKINEPMYCIITFGLGHNHASTNFFIDYHYNPNLSKTAYFTALQREEMIEACVATAIRRGDTNSVPNIKDSEETIEVFMPEMVKRNPNKEHGDGNPFHNMLEAMTETSGSVGEAAVLTIATTIIETGKS